MPRRRDTVPKAKLILTLVGIAAILVFILVDPFRPHPGHRWRGYTVVAPRGGVSGDYAEPKRIPKNWRPLVSWVLLGVAAAPVLFLLLMLLGQRRSNEHESDHVIEDQRRPPTTGAR